MSASTPQSAVAAIVRDYHADADIPRLLARLDAVCAETRDTAALIADVARRQRPAGAGPLRFGLSAFPIARATRAEAEAHLAHLTELAKLDAPARAIQRANTDPYSVMAATMAKTPRVGSNGGTAAGLVGDYDEVAARVVAFHQAGIETFMLQFQPFEADMERFAREVIPRVRRLLR